MFYSADKLLSLINRALSINVASIKKIRPTRYINKSTSRIEEYSEARALAYEQIIRNKAQLHTSEEIENYFNINVTESIIITKLNKI